MEGLEIISTYFKEFNESLIGYVSQPSTWKQEFKASCRNCNQSCLLFFTNDPNDISSFYIVLLFSF